MQEKNKYGKFVIDIQTLQSVVIQEEGCIDTELSPDDRHPYGTARLSYFDSSSDRLHIEVTPTGIAWEGILLPSSRLQEKLKELGFEKEAVLLIADQNLDFQYMDRAIAQLTEAGFTDYYFLTENPDGPIEEVN